MTDNQKDWPDTYVLESDFGIDHYCVRGRRYSPVQSQQAIFRLLLEIMRKMDAEAAWQPVREK